MAKYQCEICGRTFAKAEGKGSIKTHCAAHKAHTHPNRKKKSSGKKGKTKTVQGKKTIKSGFKKAIVTLKKGQSIDLSTGI